MNAPRISAAATAIACLLISGCHAVRYFDCQPIRLSEITASGERKRYIGFDECLAVNVPTHCYSLVARRYSFWGLQEDVRLLEDWSCPPGAKTPDYPVNRAWVQYDSRNWTPGQSQRKYEGSWEKPADAEP